MATNHDKAAKFAAVITDYLAPNTNKLHTAHDVQCYLDALPAKIRRTSTAAKQSMSVSIADVDVKFMASECNNTFMPLSNGYSYSERVARIVWNTHTMQPELWITPERFSNTTARHKQLYYAAYSNACRVNNITPVVYHTRAVTRPIATRASKAVLDSERHFERAATQLRRANAPRLHEATRYAHLDAARRNLEYQLRLLTEGIPAIEHMYATYPALRESHKETVWALTERLEFITMLQTLDVKAMRAAIAGLAALDTE